MTEAIPDATAAAHFAARLLDWHDVHGRHDLPWQQPIDAYRVWVSEIMLQQTQVGTVIPYFQRFIARFPDVRTLADAPEDEVLHHWTGLGYYARARNLHRSARIVRDEYGGTLPQAPEELAALPGIGRSTAGAICAIAWGQRTPILDGNVKRVLARCFAVAGEVSRAATLAELWAIADALTPAGRCGDYTQAIMDLGATVCTRTRPACALCPLAATCRARAEGNPARFPAKKRARAIPERRCQMLVISSPDGAVLLEKRPATGIWGGLWSFPEIPEREDPAVACDRLTGTPPASLRRGAPFRHTFSHFHLDATPVFLRVGAMRARVMEDQRLIWYKPGHERLGFAAPVKRLLDGMAREVAELEMDQQ